MIQIVRSEGLETVPLGMASAGQRCTIHAGPSRPTNDDRDGPAANDRTDRRSTMTAAIRQPDRQDALTPLLALNGITKRFPGVVANDHIDLRVMHGEIHAILGENGAGKSTLVQIVYGMLQPDVGSMTWNGAPLTVSGPAAARNLGIGMVFQHFSLFETMTVLENIALAMTGSHDMAALRARVLAISQSYGLPLDPERHVHALSVGERQRIEIVRCLLQQPKLLILDEPTSVLTPQEATRLFTTLRQLSQEGCAILYISHKLREVQALCTTATILRAGKVVADCAPRQETSESMAEMMIGKKLSSIVKTRAGITDDARIVVKGFRMSPGDQFGVELRDVSFKVWRGEIFGIAGVAGNGQTELLAALSGEVVGDCPAGAICFDGHPVGQLGPARRRALGASFVPEERYGHAAVAPMTLAENAFLTSARQMLLTSRGLIDLAGIRKLAEAVITEFDVRAAVPETAAGSLSGGNLQKFVVGREILRDPGILVASQPTWGVDAGAAMTIRQALLDLASKGCAVLVISQDLDEIFEICDRIAVISEGRVSEAMEIGTMTVSEVGLLMGGLHDLAETDTSPEPAGDAALTHG